MDSWKWDERIHSTQTDQAVLSAHLFDCPTYPHMWACACASAGDPVRIRQQHHWQHIIITTHVRWLRSCSQTVQRGLSACKDLLDENDTGIICVKGCEWIENLSGCCCVDTQCEKRSTYCYNVLRLVLHKNTVLHHVAKTLLTLEVITSRSFMRIINKNKLPNIIRATCKTPSVTSGLQYYI